MFKKFVTIIVLAGALTATSAVLANPAGDAKVRFQEGMTLFNKGAYAEAAAKFQEAYDAIEDAALLWNIGISHEKAGELERAREVYTEFLSSRGGDPRRRGQAGESLGRVGAQLAARGGVTLKVAEGDTVEAGRQGASIEAMKLEAAITTPVGGTVARLAIPVTQQVDAGDLLVVVQ